MKHCISYLIFGLIVPIVAAFGQESAAGTSTVTIGVGGAWSQSTGLGGGPTFNGTYEYRIRENWAAEFGVNTTVVSAPTFSTAYIPVNCYPATFCITQGVTSVSNVASRVTTMPFGFRYVQPLNKGKLELSIGLGAAYIWYPQVFYAGSFGTWAGQGSLGAHVAVDKNRHIWLGTTGRYFNDFRYYSRSWVDWTADVSFRFGK